MGTPEENIMLKNIMIIMCQTGNQTIFMHMAYNKR